MPDEAPASMAIKTERAKRQYLLGTILLLAVISLWVSSSFLMNAMFTDMSYNKPFFITYLCTSTFSLYLVSPAYKAFRRRIGPSPWSRHSKKRDESPSRHGSAYRPLSSYAEDEVPAFSREELTFSRSRSRSRSVTRAPHDLDPPLTILETAKLALLFCGIWFVANWSINASLGYTSVSSTTTLSSMSGFFTLGVGACAGVDEFTVKKLLNVVISVAGVILVSKADNDLPSSPESNPRTPSAPLLGDALALTSAVAYAFYVILLKVRIKNEERVSMTLFFGFVGLFNILLVWPVGVILHLTGVETWQSPQGQKLWAGILVNAGITFVSDALYLRAMLLTSPLAVTLGISLTIPIAILGDIYRGTDLGGWKSIIGGILVLLGFIANGLVDLSKTEQVQVRGAVEAAPTPDLVDSTSGRRPSEEVLLGPNRSVEL